MEVEYILLLIQECDRTLCISLIINYIVGFEDVTVANIKLMM